MPSSPLTLATSAPSSLQSAPLASGSNRRSSWTTVFDDNSRQPFSSPLDVDGFGLLFQALDLTDNEFIKLQIVVGPNGGNRYQDIVLGGMTLGLSTRQTMLLLPTPGRFRAVYTSSAASRLGSFALYAAPVSVDLFGSMEVFLSSALQNNPYARIGV